MLRSGLAARARANAEMILVWLPGTQVRSRARTRGVLHPRALFRLAGAFLQRLEPGIPPTRSTNSPWYATIEPAAAISI
jgi:hypothetical protein